MPALMVSGFLEVLALVVEGVPIEPNGLLPCLAVALPVACPLDVDVALILLSRSWNFLSISKMANLRVRISASFSLCLSFNYSIICRYGSTASLMITSNYSIHKYLY